MSSDNATNFGIGLLAGVLAGVAAGVLLAPKPGEETRNDIIKAVDKIAPKPHPSITVARQAGSTIERARLAFEEEIIRITNAIRAARMASAKHKEELESGYSL